MGVKADAKTRRVQSWKKNKKTKWWKNMKTTFYVRAIRHLKFEWNDNQHRSNKHNTHILHFSRFLFCFYSIFFLELFSQFLFLLLFIGWAQKWRWFVRILSLIGILPVEMTLFFLCVHCAVCTIKTEKNSCAFVLGFCKALEFSIYNSHWTGFFHPENCVLVSFIRKFACHT